jgi:hypothetical protein
VRRLAACLFAGLVAAAPLAAAETATPHDMLRPGGEPDTDKCAVCHEPDFSLSRSKVETCTLCHATTEHAGAAEHLRLEAARVARLVAAKQEGRPELPLTENGQMYCGTCHLFHDPRVTGEIPLEEPWVPHGALAAAVREALSAHAGPGVQFADGTTRLRLPIADGTLCKHCHGYGK